MNDTPITNLGEFLRQRLIESIAEQRINELDNEMNIIKINNESTMHSVVRNKQYIVGSFAPGAGVSFNPTPTVQYSIGQARTECKRLAKLYPGKTFFFVKMEGAEMTVAQPREVSI